MMHHLMPNAQAGRRRRRKIGRNVQWVPWMLLGLLGLFVVAVKLWG